MSARGTPSRLAAAAAALALAAAAGACAEPARPRSAILIVFDTLRRDALSVYGNPRPTTPQLDRLAREGVLFETAVTNAPWTLPALTGLLVGDYPTREHFDRGLARSLVEPLRDAGFATAAFTEGGFASADYGFDRGFDAFREQRRHSGRFGDVDRDIALTFGWAREWLEQRRDEPFFLLIHSYETHTPYRRHVFTEGLSPGRLPEEFRIGHAAMVKKGTLRLDAEELVYVRALYDGGASVCDRHLGELRETLARLGLAESTLLVVTSDHGEDLGERDPPLPGSHGHTLYDELVLVPLILFDPTREYRVKRVEAQVRTIDVMPTILELLGAPATGARHGRSLLPFLRGEETGERVAWTRIGADIEPRDVDDLIGIRAGGHKLILSPVEGDAELYDLAADPGERRNRAADDPARRAELAARVRELQRELESRGEPRFHPRPDAAGAAEQQLRALGYVE